MQLPASPAAQAGACCWLHALPALSEHFTFCLKGGAFIKAAPNPTLHQDAYNFFDHTRSNLCLPHSKGFAFPESQHCPILLWVNLWCFTFLRLNCTKHDVQPVFLCWLGELQWWHCRNFSISTTSFSSSAFLKPGSINKLFSASCTTGTSKSSLTQYG